MRVLNVAEKPSMAKQIAIALASNSYDSRPGANKYCRLYDFQVTKNGQVYQMTMTSVLGHIHSVDFPSQYAVWQKVDPGSLFEAEVLTKMGEGMDSVIKSLQQEARKSDVLYIWTDCDREGEFIGDEIRLVCIEANPRIRVYRAKYSSTTPAELSSAFNFSHTLDKRVVDAVDVRVKMDLRAGDSFGALNGHVISYGPCQFPTLGFIVEQYFKCTKFRSEKFYYLKLQIDSECGTDDFAWSRSRIYDRAITAALGQYCLFQKEAIVTKASKRPASKWRPLPLRTVELQKFASNYLKMPSNKTMQVAEKLYNDGYISYPRTETDIFDNDFDHIKIAKMQSNHHSWGPFVARLIENKSKLFARRGSNNDKAHPPIHPTKPDDGLNGDHARLYEFITRRYLACLSEDAKGEEAAVNVKVGIEEFFLTGLKVTAKNYMDVYTYDKWTEKSIGTYFVGKAFQPQQYSIFSLSGDTTAPKLLSEADLIATMDKNGIGIFADLLYIGTDATIHEHIQKILERKYAVKNREGRFHPTNLGVGLVEGFDALPLSLSLTKPSLRAKMEKDLVRICEGSALYHVVAQEYITLFKSVFFDVRANMSIVNTKMRGHLSFDPFKPAGDIPDVSFGGPSKKTPRKKPQSADFTKTSHENTTPNGSNEDGETLCNCSKPACKRTVSKEGPNKGKLFYTCSQHTSCGFFQWADIAHQSMSRNVEYSRNDNEKKCNCGLIAVKNTARGNENIGREYLSCSKVYKKCKFFEWTQNVTPATLNSGPAKRNRGAANLFGRKSRSKKT